MPQSGACSFSYKRRAYSSVNLMSSQWDERAFYFLAPIHESS